METIEHIIQQPTKRTHETPILCQHGAWHGAWCWQLWLDYFASLGYETHAISQPGHGKSSMNKRHINQYSFAEYVDTLAAQIETISPKPVVVGHSLGGAIVQKYLEQHQLPGAVLLATLPSRGLIPMALRLLWRHPVSTLSGFLTLDSYRWLNTPELAHDLFLNPKTEIDLVAFQKQLVSETFEIAFPLMFSFAKVNPAKTPVYVIAAEKDVIFTLDEERATAQRYDAKLTIVENQAHNLMMEAAWKQVADMIDGWMINDVALP